MSLPVVAVVGRPNVGKSTFFNRIIGKRQAVVAPESGVTRDQHVHPAEWNGRWFMLVDTGGIVPFGDKGVFDEPVSAIARQAMQGADAVVFVVDVRTGITTEDEAVARELRGIDKPVFLVVNKVEAKGDRAEAETFHRLGLGQPWPVTALHGEGSADVLDALVAVLPDRRPETEPDDLSVALIGRPNVGKSSLLNALVGSERALVSEIAGTTRDAIDTLLRWQKRRIRLIDTAGIRRRHKHEKGVEYYSVLRSLSSLARSDVAVLLLDATEGVVAQDARVAGEIHESGRGALIALNKWDAVPDKDDRTFLRHEDAVRRELPFLSYAPIVSISALEGQRVPRILDLCWRIGQERKKSVETSRLNDILQKALQKNPPRPYQGGTGKVYYGTQTGTAPPVFRLYVNRPEIFPRHYIRYLNNQLRAELGFEGTRIRLDLRKRS
jgi:GTP-binding protein